MIFYSKRHDSPILQSFLRKTQRKTTAIHHEISWRIILLLFIFSPRLLNTVILTPIECPLGEWQRKVYLLLSIQLCYLSVILRENDSYNPNFHSIKRIKISFEKIQCIFRFFSRVVYKRLGCPAKSLHLSDVRHDFFSFFFFRVITIFNKGGRRKTPSLPKYRWADADSFPLCSFPFFLSHCSFTPSFFHLLVSYSSFSSLLDSLCTTIIIHRVLFPYLYLLLYGFLCSTIFKVYY